MQLLLVLSYHAMLSLPKRTLCERLLHDDTNSGCIGD